LAKDQTQMGLFWSMTDIPRPKTPEEWEIFKQNRKDQKRKDILTALVGRTIIGTFEYDHSKSGDLDIYLDDGSYLHICSDGNDIFFRRMHNDRTPFN
jgi:hypothetical protein